MAKKQTNSHSERTINLNFTWPRQQARSTSKVNNILNILESRKLEILFTKEPRVEVLENAEKKPTQKKKKVNESF